MHFPTFVQTFGFLSLVMAVALDTAALWVAAVACGLVLVVLGVVRFWLWMEREELDSMVRDRHGDDFVAPDGSPLSFEDWMGKAYGDIEDDPELELSLRREHRRYVRQINRTRKKK